MDPIGDDLLRIIRPEIGYREGPGRHSKFGEWYAANVVQDPQYETAPWCAMFIAWAAERAGVPEYVGQFAWTPSQARWFETNGAWSRTPEPGALVFFDWSGGKDIKGIDHVGVVESVEGGTIHTIEGNVDRVWLKRKTRDQSKVVGYGLPRKVKENLTGAASDTDGSTPQTVGRIEVRPAPAPGSTALADTSAMSPVSVETAMVAGLLTFVLGTSFVLSRLRPRVSAGRHRMRSGRQEPRRRAERSTGGAPPAEAALSPAGASKAEIALSPAMASKAEAALSLTGASERDRTGRPDTTPHNYETLRVSRPGWAHEPYRAERAGRPRSVIGRTPETSAPETSAPETEACRAA
ncbi:CHAP domain-containing protein [Streptosporangium sp. NBC_01810]|uniref:CHAP domain-containing protein n=1 Tax=Streptosporangium sp. NBC_01810 TaxID=2975951 RepID=UPI002DD9CD96|nr:CHAP domain-containing protein [Streptosporangium sp. NBC_01810]WSA28465.1 CHAP domain-containing protein [Streptosporangium sp. NBC_01810]